MSPLILSILVGVIVVAVIAVVIAGIRATRGPDQEDPLMARLAEAARRGDVIKSIEQIEMQQPFADRVLLPILQQIGRISTTFTPQKVLQDTTRKLEMAGNPGRIDAATFLASRFFIAAAFGGLLLLISIFSPNRWPLGQTILVVTVFTLLGFFFP